MLYVRTRVVSTLFHSILVLTWDGLNSLASSSIFNNNKCFNDYRKTELVRFTNTLVLFNSFF